LSLLARRSCDPRYVTYSISISRYFAGGRPDTYQRIAEGLVQVDTTAGTVTPSARLWAFANYSSFVRPGAIRIGASSAIPYLTDATHDTAGGRPEAVTHGSFSMNLPARSLVTFFLPAR
jgi:O-glycosyl hydrolase